MGLEYLSGTGLIRESPIRMGDFPRGTKIASREPSEQKRE
jgi:hypothetical protein